MSDPVFFKNVLIFTTGGVLGFLLKTFLGHSLALSRIFQSIRINEFNKAAAPFRAAFVDEIHSLRSNSKSGDTDVYKIISDNTFISHEKAKILFEPFIPSDELEAFNCTWDEYKNYEYTFYTKLKTPYHPCNIEQRQELSNNYLNHIDKLLGFAQPKVNT